MISSYLEKSKYSVECDGGGVLKIGDLLFVGEVTPSNFWM